MKQNVTSGRRKNKLKQAAETRFKIREQTQRQAVENSLSQKLKWQQRSSSQCAQCVELFSLNVDKVTKRGRAHNVKWCENTEGETLTKM